MINTKIQWTNNTVNFWHGCQKVSEGCKFCYMYRDKERYGQEPTTVLRSKDITFNQALKWKDPRRIFTCSWSDFFIEDADGWRKDAWDVIRKTPQHTWQILTKRPGRILECLPDDWGEGWDNVWLGVSVENQNNFHRAITLSQIPAKIRFISAEPLLGELDILVSHDEKRVMDYFHWCIIGGESGNETGKYLYRECKQEWIEKIITDLEKTEMKVFVKQMGTYLAKQMKLKDTHGGEIEEWPDVLRIREFPEVSNQRVRVSHDEKHDLVEFNSKEEQRHNNNVMSDNKNKNMEHNNLMNSPTIPDMVYDNLPEFLQKCVAPFTDQRERDVMLSSSLAILSGCFTNCKGKYRNDWVAPNLYSFIVAPPASGKSTMKYAALLGKPIHKMYVDENEKAKAEYDAEMRVWNKGRKSKKSKASAPPVKPKYPVLFLPGNTSAAAIYNKLNDSKGIGIICETEADTLSGAIKQDWGNFSDMLRKSFQHEDITLARATNDVYISIENPKLSTLLTGTPDQVPKLIKSADDGLTSRFIFYAYRRKMEFLDPMPCTSCPDLAELFIGLGDGVASIKNKLDIAEHIFSLTPNQFAELKKNFSDKLYVVELFEGQGASNAVYRLGLIAFRIAMILTILRSTQEAVIDKVLICNDNDFLVALSLTDVYFEHALIMYSMLPKNSNVNMNPQMRRFYSALPLGQFKRKDADKIADSIGISPKSVFNYLDKFAAEGLITKPSYGNFLKKIRED